ncbi:macrolide 2'-phosphotransferase [Paenarthrobacter sp. PH39-S1]|uniref:macrolide 2'-phosphotransferase n=1 Tax=Paenarthrobacter sp. PH39-S1 TaxID=3046204 RepID=UPI0024B9C3CC|nr:macrolide 2'-phosphotransferase [Paenarthrobacter sp. PH39-S1]MDJ0355558.1 phosphotransferase [Paenarthrobacter sp. PH39-S1]
MTPIELAAVATAAVPGLAPVACAPEPDDAADFDSAMLLDSDRKRWRVRSPKHPEASARLETELLVLRAFSPGIRAELPFLMPTVAGTVRRGELTTFVYSHLSGAPRSVEELAGGGTTLAKEIGTTMAAIHDLPPGLVNNADLPSYTANEFRQRRLNELDQAATTGKIPATLLRRWEHALEDVALWRFSPCVVHGDLHEDNVLVEDRRVTAVTGWTDLRVGDPADDFAWLVAINDQPFVDAVQEAYAAARKESPDRHLLRRAALSAEFALAQWLVKGVAANDSRMVAEAEEMLRTLENDIATFGGQPISTEPEIPATPATGTASVTGSSVPVSNAKETDGRHDDDDDAGSAGSAGVAEVSSNAEASHKVTVGKIAGATIPAASISAEPVPADAVSGTDTAVAPAPSPDNGQDRREDAKPGDDGDAATVLPGSAAGNTAVGTPEGTSAEKTSAEDTSTTAMKVIPLHSV